jgi:DNA-binding transcriptional LysR family regulator
VAGFRARYPDLRVNLKESDAFGIGEAVLNHEVDFGVSTTPGPRGELHAELVATDPMVLVCGRSSPLAKKRSVKWAELKRERLMGYKPSSSMRQMVDGMLAKTGIELLWFDEVDTLSSLIAYLRTGQFTGVVPKVIGSQLGGLAVVPLSAPRIERRIYLLRRKDTELTPPAQAFWNDVRKRLGTALKG